MPDKETLFISQASSLALCFHHTGIFYILWLEPHLFEIFYFHDCFSGVCVNYYAYLMLYCYVNLWLELPCSHNFAEASCCYICFLSACLLVYSVVFIVHNHPLSLGYKTERDNEHEGGAIALHWLF